MNAKRAFTLIELLVVIAIIAILAAILFPVFAQAKQAAKGTASLSNTKQTVLAELMYQNDYDDSFIPTNSWNTGNDIVCFGGGVCESPWTFTILPYIKNTQIYNDPAGPAQYSPPIFGISDLQNEYAPMYGYNHTALAPYYNTDNPWAPTQHPRISTQAVNPAGLIMFTSKFHDSETTWDNTPGCGPHLCSLGFWLNPKDEGPMYNNATDPPNCWPIHGYCAGNWGVPDGVDGQWNMFTGGLSAIIPGVNTGGNSRRVADGIQCGFVDGHAKKIKAGGAASGTNWSDIQNQCLTKVTTYSAYLWILDPKIDLIPGATNCDGSPAQ